MYRNHKIALVVPAHNEERLIVPTLDSVPDYFDAVYIVDDASSDKMPELVREYSRRDSRVHLLQHETCRGPGAGIITGYLQAAKDQNDLVIVIGGDNQMKLDEATRFLDPLVDKQADYTKGNRFLLGKIDDTLAKMPRTRLFGNWLITGLTKVASGYYKVFDVVDGYTGITREAIERIDWNKAWQGYGYPMDFLIRLNAYGLRVKDIPRTAIYLPGERQSQIKGTKYALKVSPMLVRHFFWRLFFKYLYLDFHPLALFYFLGIPLFSGGFLMGIYLAIHRLVMGPPVSGATAIFCALLVLTGLQLVLFAMFFDMQEGNRTTVEGR